MLASSLSHGATPPPRRNLWIPMLAGFASALPLVMLAADAPAPAGGDASASSAPAEVQFMRDIAPLLAQRCFSCHGNVKEPEGDLRLDIYERMTKGEHAAVVPGEPEHSEIIDRLTEEDASSRMPRDEDPLTPAQIDIIRRWIKAGAKFDGPDPKAPYKATPASAQAASPHPTHAPHSTPH